MQNLPKVLKGKSSRNGKDLSSAKSGARKSKMIERREIEFCVKAPAAQSVRLAADFTNWEAFSIQMTKYAGGVWHAAVPLDPGHYAYRFIVDGEWRNDPSCAQSMANPFGTTNSVIHVV